MTVGVSELVSNGGQVSDDRLTVAQDCSKDHFLVLTWSKVELLASQ